MVSKGTDEIASEPRYAEKESYKSSYLISPHADYCYC